MHQDEPVVRVTINDVAAAAGVSRQTVSRVLNGKNEISPATRSRVLAVVESLDYRPNHFARGMRTQRSHTIGLIVSDIANPFYPAVARGLFDAATQVGWNVVVYNTDMSGVRESEALADLAARGADGVAGFFYSVDEPLLAKHAARLPLVIADRVLDDPSLTSVSSDFRDGIRAAVDHLTERGHTRIGMLDSSMGVASDVRREAFVALRGGRDAPMVEGPPTIPGGAAALHELWRVAAVPVTAVVAFNDLMAIGAIHALRERGLRVPADVAVTGFDDLAIAPYVDPPLTTVHTDKYALGRCLAESLHRLTENRQAAERVVLPATLIVRSSS